MINLKKLRDDGARPRVHGNGFIQIDMTERSRLHIWGDPRLPRQKVATPIHDHTFGFTSTIIVGRLVNITYRFMRVPWGEYQIYTPTIREGEDTVLDPTGDFGSITSSRTELVTWGRIEDVVVNKWLTTQSNPLKKQYSIKPHDFHETFAPEPTATIIIKDDLTLAQGGEPPRVLVLRGREPDNEFNRYDADEDLLWKITEDTLKRRYD